MAIAFDAFSNAAANANDHSWTHTPVGTPRGVLVLGVQDTTDLDDITGVTYGGVAMAEVALSPKLSNAGSAEASSVYGYFLGASIPTGAQTVAVTTGGGGITKRFAAITVTAAQNTSVVDTSGVDSASLANPSVTLSLGGITCFCAIGFHSGQGAVTGITPLTNWTSRLEHDFGAAVAGWYTYNTIASADVTAGYTATAEDANLLAVAIRENAAGGATQPPRTMHQFRMRRTA
jgi:hypothetical protein